VDVCSVCDALAAKLRDKCLDDNNKRIAAAELMVHERRAKKFYSMKVVAANKDEDTCVL
jgi:hypothetical protein